jgi:hypothetical protein
MFSSFDPAAPGSLGNQCSQALCPRRSPSVTQNTRSFIDSIKIKYRSHVCKADMSAKVNVQNLSNISTYG